MFTYFNAIVPHTSYAEFTDRGAADFGGGSSFQSSQLSWNASASDEVGARHLQSKGRAALTRSRADR